MIHRCFATDLTLYNVYMNYFLRAREIDKGHKIFQEIKEHGYALDVHTQSTLMHGLIYASEAHETYKLFYVMKEQGCELDTLAYNTTIDGFCKLGKVKNPTNSLRK